MFVVPEILWSPIYKVYYYTSMPLKDGSYQVWRENFLDKSGNAGLWGNIVLLQFCGILFAAIYLIIIRKSFKNKLLVWLTAVVLLFASLYVLWLYGLSTITIKIL